ncbi:23S rRNA pseudouridylate synthase B, partial [Bordetella bronchiseptica]
KPASPTGNRGPAAPKPQRARRGGGGAGGGGGGRGDDWQPKGAGAHESRLGFMGGRGGRGR